MVFQITTYGSETWAVGRTDRSKIQAFWNLVLAEDVVNLLEKAYKTNEFVRGQIRDHTL